MVMKRILVLLLAGILSFGGIASARYNAIPQEGGGVDISSIQFFGEAAKLLQDSAQEDESYFSSITLTLDKDTMLVDGIEMPVLSPYMADSGEMLPITDIAEAIGAQVDIDSVSGEITIENDGEVIELDSPPDADNFELYALDEVAELLTLDYAIEGDDIILTSPFQSKMLLVRMNPGKTLPNTYGATDFVSDGNGNYVLKYDSISLTKDAYDTINALPDCQNIAPNLIVFLFDTPEGPDITPFMLPVPSWGTERIRADLMKKYLIENGKTATDYTIAVVDTGLQPDHPHFLNRLVPGQNLTTSGDGNPEYMADGKGHGTHVAGTLVDCTPDNVKIMPIKIFSDSGASATATEILLAINWATDHGAKVINISAGGTSTLETNWDWYFKEACEYAVSKGVTIVTASGNNNVDTKYVSPARLPNVITVAAINKSDQKSIYPTMIPKGASNYGDAVDIAAPGTDIESSWITSIYRVSSGTSMAAPHVAAAVAMLSLNDPSLDPEGLRSAVRATTIDLGVSGWDRVYGAGVLDFRVFFKAAAIHATEISVAQESVTFDNYTNLPRWIDIFVGGENVTDKSFSVVSSNPNVAIYNEDGNVAPKGLGKALLTFTTENGLHASCIIYVGDQSSTGVTVSGKVTSFNPGNETILKLLQNDHVAAEITIAKATGYGQIVQPFAFENIAPGTYNLVISKKNHLSYTITNIIVGSENLDLTKNTNPKINTIVLPCGDINEDGYINSSDLSIIILPSNYDKHVSQAGVNPSADLAGNGWVDSTSLSIIILPANYDKTPIVCPYTS